MRVWVFKARLWHNPAKRRLPTAESSFSFGVDEHLPKLVWVQVLWWWSSVRFLWKARFGRCSWSTPCSPDALVSAAMGTSSLLLPSRPRRSRKAVFSLLQTSVVVGLFVQWLKLFPRMLEVQAGLLPSVWPLWFWERGYKRLIWEVQGCGTWVGRGASLFFASGLLFPSF